LAFFEGVTQQELASFSARNLVPERRILSLTRIQPWSQGLTLAVVLALLWVTLRIVAEQADIWHWFGSTETFAQKTKVLDKWCEKVGRDPADVDRSIGVSAGSVHLGDEYVALGANEITIGISGPDLDLSPVAKWIAWRDG
ncbi:MAG: hypothetical protein IIC70_12305, partial [Acidobacteria bacterium]|nr:hypothetical protein [Acidobacteriota bacterium]